MEEIDTLETVQCLASTIADLPEPTSQVEATHVDEIGVTSTLEAAVKICEEYESQN